MLPTPELEIARNLPQANCTPAEAERYTRWLATHHYENFNVVSWLLPRRLHQHFYNVYAYCRWADDLGDEVADPARALQLLDAWENELRLIYADGAGPAHPVLIALRETIRAKDIPLQPFCDLLRAFRQDQTVQRYSTWDEVLDYCVYSANPVGRLVLYLCGYRDELRQKLSDFTCTALQLANFLQDVSRDLEKGRIYIPLEALAAHGLSADDIVDKRFDARYTELMKSLIARTRELFGAGRPLAQTVPPFLSVDLEMFSRGGLAILDAIEASGYNTLEHRPSLSKWTRPNFWARRLRLVHFRAAESRSTRLQPQTKATRRKLRQLRVKIQMMLCRAIAASSSSVRTPTRCANPTRNAIASRARRTAASIWRFSGCARKSATRSAPCTLSCA